MRERLSRRDFFAEQEECLGTERQTKSLAGAPKEPEVCLSVNFAIFAIDSPEIFQYLDLPLDLLLLDWLEGLDDALLIVGHVDRLENLAILAAAELADELVVVLREAIF